MRSLASMAEMKPTTIDTFLTVTVKGPGSSNSLQSLWGQTGHFTKKHYQILVKLLSLVLVKDSKKSLHYTFKF